MKAHIAFITAALLLSASEAGARFDHDRHVVFSGSWSDRTYYHSEVTSVAPSRIDAPGGKLPVEKIRCVTAPNCLRLRWRSRFGGAWRVGLKTQKHWGSLPPVGDTLSMWVRSGEGLTADASPLIQLTDTTGQGTPHIRLLGSLQAIPAGQWIHLRLPLRSFTGEIQSTSAERFDPTKIAAVNIGQGLDDGKQHTLTIDEVTISRAAP
ncbi:MAG TPA: hypothetical protein VNO33_21040, partial [Kofleriaceae bacterium]|nr:hypothetical protein [Kofleriaceae bacterium]